MRYVVGGCLELLDLVAVKDVLGHLADYDSANGPPLLFYLPQLAHVYYRTLPPLDGDAALTLDVGGGVFVESGSQIVQVRSATGLVTGFLLRR